MPMSDLDHELNCAITTPDLKRVQALISLRNQVGERVVDLNKVRAHGHTPLQMALFSSNFNESLRTKKKIADAEQIVEAILNERDSLNNVVVNLHHSRPYVRTAIASLFQDEIPPSTRLKLLELILNTRNADGQPAFNFSLVNHGDVLRHVIHSNDLDCLRILLDLRNHDGAYALDVNQLDEFNCTVLDWTANNFSRAVRQDIVAAIQARGGLRSNDRRYQRPLTHRQTTVQTAQAAPTRPANLTAAHLAAQTTSRANNTAAQLPRAARAFVDNPQNIHDPSVENTVKGSILALEQLYGSTLDENAWFPAMASLIEAFDYNQLTINQDLTFEDKKVSAKLFFKDVEKRRYFTHSRTGLTFNRIYALIWRAVNDTSLDVLPNDIRHTVDTNAAETPSYLIEIRRASLVEKMVEADQIYRQDGRELDICDGGAVNKSVEALNMAHNSVVVCAGTLSVKPAANQAALGFVSESLRNKTIKEQRNILRNWDSVDETVASAFKAEMVSAANTKLALLFGILLTERERAEITGAFEYLPQPSMHPLLDALISEIEKLPEVTELASNAALVGLKAKAKAKQAFDESEVSFQDEYVALLKAYNEVLTAYIAEIEALQPDVDGMQFQPLEILKNKAKSISDDNSIPEHQKLKALLTAYKQFKNPVEQNMPAPQHTLKNVLGVLGIGAVASGSAVAFMLTSSLTGAALIGVTGGIAAGIILLGVAIWIGVALYNQSQTSHSQKYTVRSTGKNDAAAVLLAQNPTFTAQANAGSRPLDQADASQNSSCFSFLKLRL